MGSLPQGDWVWLKKFPGDQHSEVKPATKLAFCKVGSGDGGGRGEGAGCGDNGGMWGQRWDVGRLWWDIETVVGCGGGGGTWGQLGDMGTGVGHGDRGGMWGQEWDMGRGVRRREGVGCVVGGGTWR